YYSQRSHIITVKSYRSCCCSLGLKEARNGAVGERLDVLPRGSSGPRKYPPRQSRGHGAAGLSCCLMPTIGLLAGMPELGLIRNMGRAPSFYI
ncbi:hypothetical protein KUCAC02_007593, partial [Chaenocephalus aceratus]